MLYIIAILVICIFVSISTALIIWEDGLRGHVSIFVMAIIILISCVKLLHDYYYEIREDDIVIQEQVETPKPVEYFSIPKSLTILEQIATPTITPDPISEPEPIIEEESKPVRYAFTDNDIYLMARLLCGSKYKDGDGEYDFDFGNSDRYDQISLVLNVVMNRVRDDRFPDTVEGVITQRYKGQNYQFSAVALWKSNNGEVSDIAIQRVTEWCEAYNRGPMGSQSIPENYVYFSGNGRGVNVARSRL